MPLPAEPTEFEVAGKKYRAHKMDAMKQWHVVRRLSPLVGSLVAVAAKAQSENADKEAKQGEGASPPKDATFLDAMATPQMQGVITAMGQALSSLSDEDSEFIINACLAVCEREAPNGSAWVKLWNEAAKRPATNDLDMGVMLRITLFVLKDSLASFFPEIRSIFSGLQPT